MLIKKQKYSAELASGLAISAIESLEPAKLDEFFITLKGRKQLVKGDFVPYSPEPIRFFVADNMHKQEHELSLSGIDTEDISIRQETGDFTSGLKVSFAADAIKLNLDSSGLKGEPRDIKYRIRVPLPESLFPWNLKWRIWTATHGYPKAVFNLPDTFCVNYGGPDGASIIPCITLFDVETDIGLTLVNALDTETPKVQFIIKRDERCVDAELSCFMLSESHATRAEFHLYFHQADWRCGLGKIYERYPEYFEPNNPAINDTHIYMTQTEWETPIHADRDYIEESLNTVNKGLDVNFSEVHFYFSKYGMYMPEDTREGWLMDVHAHLGRAPLPMSLEIVHQHLADLRSFGIKPLLYFQPLGSCNGELAAEKFADSIVADTPGGGNVAGASHVLCNCDETTSFGRDIRRQLKRLLAEFEADSDGIFWDNLCFGFFDYAHSDGVSMIDGRPVYNLTFGYKRFKKELFPYLKEKGKFVFGNGAHNVEAVKGLDCLMAESHPWLIEHLSYLCLARPLNVFYYRHHTKDIAEYEEMFQLSLQWGCFPSARIDVNTEEVHDLFLKYKRFLDLLIGKKWVLEKAPFKLPMGWKGNLFKNRGGYVVFAIRDLQGFTTEGSLKISLKAKYCGDIKVIGISGTELAYRKEESGDYVDLEIESSEFVNAVVIEQ